MGKYNDKTNGEIREEILQSVGIETDRYTKDRKKNFTKHHLREIGESIESGSTDRSMIVPDLFRLICSLCGTEYGEDKGRRHGLNRENLIEIHKEVCDTTKIESPY